MITTKSRTYNKFCALVPAAGLGTRMQSDVRKPFLLLDSVPVLFHTLCRINASAGCEKIILAVHPYDLDNFKNRYGSFLKTRFRVSEIVAGGSTRQQTVFNMLCHMPCRERDVVVVHDAARPLVLPDTVERAVLALENGADGAVTAVHANATVKEVNENGAISSTPPRRSLWLAQTPQVFFAKTLLSSYKKAADYGWVATDDAEIAEKAGHHVVVSMGDYENIKITNPHDLDIAEAILRRQKKKCLFDVAELKRELESRYTLLLNYGTI